MSWSARTSGPGAEGGELLLVICAAAVLRIFALTGIDRLIPNFPDLDQALAPTSVVPDFSPPGALAAVSAAAETLGSR